MRKLLHRAQLAGFLGLLLSCLSVAAADKPKFPPARPEPPPQAQLGPNEAFCRGYREPDGTMREVMERTNFIQVLVPVVAPAKLAQLRKRQPGVMSTETYEAYQRNPDYVSMQFHNAIESLRNSTGVFWTGYLSPRDRIIALTDVLMRAQAVSELWGRFVKLPTARKLPQAAIARGTKMANMTELISDDIRCWAFALTEPPLIGNPKR